MEGWIKLYDKMLNWEWYRDTNVVRVFLHCLLKANYQDKKWCGQVIKRGQFVTSVATLATELTLSPMQVRTVINKLKKTEEITSETTNQYTIITICKYETYQGCKAGTQQATQQTDNKQITNEQQTDNKRITTTTEYTDNTEEQNKESNTEVLPKKRSSFSLKEQLISDGLDKELVEAYMQVRKSKKAPDSIVAYKGLTREANKAGISIDAAITECVERNWVGFKAEWYNRVNNNNNASIQHDNRQDRRRESSVSDFSQQEAISF